MERARISALAVAILAMLSGLAIRKYDRHQASEIERTSPVLYLDHAGQAEDVRAMFESDDPEPDPG